MQFGMSESLWTFLAFISGARENELGTNTPLIRALKYASIGTITIHLMSCGWYAIACPNIGSAEMLCDAESWAVKLKTGRSCHVRLICADNY